MSRLFRWMSLVMCAALALGVVGVVVAVPASAKTNTVILNGADWLDGNGVDVYSNDGSFDSADNDFNYVNIGTAEHPNRIQSGFRWQCVELVNRLYLVHGWTDRTWSGDGYQMYDKAPSNLTKEPAGSLTSVNPGDVIVLYSTNHGHVAIVDSVNDLPDNKAVVHTVSQNLTTSNNDSRRDFTWDKSAKTIVPWSGFTFTGIVHAPISTHNGPFRVLQQPTITPSSPHMYEPITYTFRFKNTSDDVAWIKRLVVAVRGPGNNPLDMICAQELLLSVGQEWSCSLSVQQGYGSRGTFEYWADWLDWDDYWHTGDLGPRRTFAVGAPYALTAVQSVSVGPSDVMAMYTPINWSYRVRNTSGSGASIQRLVVAVRGPGNNALDVPCVGGNGVTLAPNAEWTCNATLPQGYGQRGPYTFWADWLDYSNQWHHGQLGGDKPLTLAQAPTLTAVGPLSVGPSDQLVMYQPLQWSYRIRNTSGSYASIQRLVVAVRTPDGSNMDVQCAGGSGLTLAPGEEWTCSAINGNGYGSRGTFVFWADWLDYGNVWHTGQLSSYLSLRVN